MSDLRSLLQHGGHGTIPFLREAHRVFHRLWCDASVDTVGEMDFSKNGGVFGSPLTFRAHLKAGERLTLLPQDTYDVGSRAAAKRDQDEFHGAVGGLFFTGVDDNRVAGTRFSDESFLVRPIYRCFH